MKIQKTSTNVSPFAGISFVNNEFEKVGMCQLIDSVFKKIYHFWLLHGLCFIRQRHPFMIPLPFFTSMSSSRDFGSLKRRYLASCKFLDIPLPVLSIFYVYNLMKRILSGCPDLLLADCFKCLHLQLQDLPSNFFEVVGAYPQTDVSFVVMIAPIRTTVEPPVFQFINI